MYAEFTHPLTHSTHRTHPDRIEDGEDEEWMGMHNIDGHAVSYPLDPTRWWPHAGMLDDKEDETGGRWASHLSLFCTLERAPDLINIFPDAWE